MRRLDDELGFLDALMSDFRPWMVLDLEDLHLFVGIPPQGINPASLATESQAER